MTTGFRAPISLLYKVRQDVQDVLQNQYETFNRENTKQKTMHSACMLALASCAALDDISRAHRGNAAISVFSPGLKIKLFARPRRHHTLLRKPDYKVVSFLLQAFYPLQCRQC